MINNLKKLIHIFFSIFLMTFFLPQPKINAHTYDEFKTVTPKTITVGTNATFEPFEYIESDGSIVGFDIDLIKEIVNILGYQIEIVNMPFEALLSAIQTGKIDLVIAGMTATDERRKTVDFSRPYFEGHQFLLSLNNKQLTNEKDLANCTIAPQIGTTANNIAKELQQKLENVKIKEYDEYDIMVEDLIRNRHDIVILDEIVAKKHELKHKGKIKLTDPTKFINVPTENCCIACSKDNKNLLNAVDDALLKVKSSDRYNELLKKYMHIDNMKATNQETEQENKNILTSLKNQFNTAFIEKGRWKLYFKGLGVTLTVTFFAAIIGIFIGIILAIMRLSKNKKDKKSILSKFASIYISIIRGTPVLVQLLIMWLIILKNAKNGIFVASLAFGFNSAAYAAEILRGGINAVSKGQTEASYAMGFSKIQTMVYIVLPQGIKNSIPSLCNEFISLVKETAVVGYVALNDLTRTAFSISATTYQTFMPLMVTALLYFAVTKTASIILEIIERRLEK